jgi:hypothetical protein
VRAGLVLRASVSGVKPPVPYPEAVAGVGGDFAVGVDASDSLELVVGEVEVARAVEGEPEGQERSAFVAGPPSPDRLPSIEPGCLGPRRR